MPRGPNRSCFAAAKEVEPTEVQHVGALERALGGKGELLERFVSGKRAALMGPVAGPVLLSISVVRSTAANC